MPIEIRYARLSDTEMVAKIFRAVVSPLAIYSEEARQGEIEKFNSEGLTARISADPKAVIIAMQADMPVGFAITDDQHGPIWLEWYGVLNEARGLGVGQALVQFLFKEAPTRGATKFWCDTRQNNTASIALFEKVGFRKLCELNNHWYGQDFYLWERMI